MDRRLNDLQVLLGSAEDQVEIAERVEIAEVFALARQHFVIPAEQHLGAAQRVRHAGVDEIAEQVGKAAVGDEIERSHRLVLHGIDETGAVDELGFAAFDHRVIFRQGFRRHSEVGVQDHQHVAGRSGKALAYGIALALAVLPQHLDVPLLLVGVADALAFGEGIVAGIALDEDDLLVRTEFGHAQDRILDVAALVATGNDDARRIFAVREQAPRAADHIAAQGKLPDARQRCDVLVDQRPESEPAPRQKLSLLLADHLEIGEVHQVEEIGGRDVVDLRLLVAETNRLRGLQDRLPQVGVVGDDQPRRRRAKLVDQPQRAVDVLEQPDGVGEHDVVERALDRGERRRILDIAEHEVEMRVVQPCPLHRLFAEIDADTVGRLQCSQHVSATAAELEHAFAGRNQKAHELAVVVVIGGVEPAPALDVLERGIHALAQGQLSRIVGQG